jgi:hypothetical protein
MARDTYDMFRSPDRGRFGDGESSPRGPRVSGASDFHDLDLVLHHETDRAILVSADGKEASAAWLPKSRVEVFRGDLATRGTRKSGQLVRLPVVTVSIPEALAREKGLL